MTSLRCCVHCNFFNSIFPQLSLMSLNGKDASIISSRLLNHHIFASWHIQKLTSGNLYLVHKFLVCKTCSFWVYRNAVPKNNFFLYPNNPFINGVLRLHFIILVTTSKALLLAFSFYTPFKLTALLTHVILKRIL